MVIDTPIHFIDFEGNAESGILEFGVVTLRGGEVGETRTRLCQPTGRIRAEDSRVHGLREPDLWDAAPFNEEWEFFAGLRQTGPLAAHFAQVENHLLRAVWDYPRSAPDFARPGTSVAEWGPWIDTGRLYPQCFPQLGESKLERLVAATGLQAELDALATQHTPLERRRYHAALYDALAGALLLRALLQRAEFASATLPWLLQMSTLNPERRQDLQQGELL